jgi:pimeloyl-ACP methyl ester carboxylesterase
MTDQPNVVLIHGAFADGSSWSAVIEDLQAKGYEVTAPQFALTSLADDLARLRQVLAWLDGPTIVVGAFLRRADHHRARRRHGQRPRAGLPRRVRARRGESIAALGSDAPPAPALANLIVDQQGFGPLPEDDFVGPLPGRRRSRQGEGHARSSTTGRDECFKDTMGTPAWKSLPSWYLVAANDQAIAPDAERMFAKRMGAETVEVASGHVAMVSHPDAVVELTEAAAKQTADAGAREGATA